MRKGRQQKIDWKKYRTSQFHFPSDPPGSVQCGAYALYAITKKPYKEIEKLRKDECWPTHVMLKYLKDNGYEVLPVTLGNMVEGHSVNDFSKPRITERNVVLIDQKCFREENSWCVLYGNMIAHSADVSALPPLEFLNWPIEAAYVVFHPKWRD
jgi:hypothetical protein